MWGAYRPAVKVKNPCANNTKDFAIFYVDKQLLKITWPFLVIIPLLLVLTIVSAEALSAVRAFVNGESLWSKSQKQAINALNLYAISHDERDYQAYLDAISVPLGDHKARLALNQPTPDLDAAYQGFDAGMNHPDDIPGLISLYLVFKDTALMERPIAMWVQGDAYIAELNQAAMQLHRHITNGETDYNQLRPVLETINRINNELTPIENAFSYTLGEASRDAKWLVILLMLAATLFLLSLGLYLSYRMVRQNAAAGLALRESELRLRAIVDTAMDALVEIDVNGVITRWSNQAENIFAWPKSEAVGKRLNELILPPNSSKAQIEEIKNLHEYMPDAHNKRLEITALRKDGTEFPAELTLSTVSWGMDSESCIFIRDITKRKQAAEKLVQLAHYDSVTGLPNRVLFQDRLEQQIKKANRTYLPLALMFLDVDRFKEVNDTLGHSKGDALLRETARRLLACVRETDTVARMGGDEFTIILADLEDLNSIERISQNILRQIAEPYDLGGELAYVSVSIGITMYPDDAQAADALLKNADQAMYLAKKNGRNRASYFTAAMQLAAQRRLMLANDLHAAITQTQFRVYYQPIVQLSDGKITKAEALVRWEHPIHGLINPADFVPIAEETGMIVDIGNWVFRTAAAQAMDWRARFDQDFQVSINKSPMQFQYARDHDTSWSTQIKTLNVSGASIVVEITEGMMMDLNDNTKSKLIEFRDAGIQVALDDFGTGYSSLSYLSEFDIDYIKIDRSFVNDLRADSDRMILCEAIIVMAHKLGIQVVAEGVETVEQRELLQRAGCDYAQGYLFSQPLPTEAFEALLANV
jgi:diguanylate cyclase (GGDEF)-like protein/PAS domain S-box-containing protein